MLLDSILNWTARHKGSSQWRLCFLILSEHFPGFPKSCLLSHYYRVPHFFLPVFFSGFSPLSERTDPPSARSDFSPLSEPPALLPSLRVPSSVDEVVGLVCPPLVISSCSLILEFILVIQLFRSSCRPKRDWRLHAKNLTWINVTSYNQDCTESARRTPIESFGDFYRIAPPVIHKVLHIPQPLCFSLLKG